MPQAVVHIIKKHKSSGGDTMAYLFENSEKDFQLQETVLELCREELELNKSRETLFCQQSQIMMTVLRKLTDKIWKTGNFSGSPSILFLNFQYFNPIAFNVPLI